MRVVYTPPFSPFSPHVPFPLLKFDCPVVPPPSLYRLLFFFSTHQMWELLLWRQVMSEHPLHAIKGFHMPTCTSITNEHLNPYPGMYYQLQPNCEQRELVVTDYSRGKVQLSKFITLLWLIFCQMRTPAGFMYSLHIIHNNAQDRVKWTGVEKQICKDLKALIMQTCIRLC